MTESEKRDEVDNDISFYGNVFSKFAKLQTILYDYFSSLPTADLRQKRWQ